MLSKEKVLRITTSFCPKCKKELKAEIIEEEGKIKIKKTCPSHGEFEDIYWSNSEHYKKIMAFEFEPKPITNPRTFRDKGCPYDCGICNEHKSCTILGIIDVTNRCNMNCPICFADASKSYIYEPSKEQIREMLLNLKKNKPIPPVALQFSGGEPTLRDDLPELVEMAKSLGFSFVMVDSNGIRLAKDLSYLKALKDAGMDSIYLQFDGLDDSVYEKIRGMKMLNLKMRVLENCRRIDFRNVVLVVTLIKGINDSQVGGIIKFAVKNSDIVTCVNFQPISFAGRASKQEVREKRITTYDFVRLVEEQTKGKIRIEDFYTIPSTVPISSFVSTLKKKEVPFLTTHPCCGVGTYIILDSKGDYKPITKLMDFEDFLSSLKRYTEEISKNNELGMISKLKIFGEILKSVSDPERRNFLLDLLKKGDETSVRRFHKNAIMIGCMHFMDLWNFDLERVKRCVIHYATPDGRLIPFCSYNSFHRESVERKFSRRGSTSV